MTIGKLSGQCDFGQKGQSYCNQRGQSCVAKRVKVAWLFQGSQNPMYRGIFIDAHLSIGFIIGCFVACTHIRCDWLSGEMS